MTFIGDLVLGRWLLYSTLDGASICLALNSKYFRVARTIFKESIGMLLK